MTNLSSDRPKWRQRFSRERVLIGAPVVAGLLAAVALAIIDGKPRLERLSVQTERLEELRRKQAALPGLIEQLRQAERRALEVAQQQAVLVDLIAGRDKIETFLAQVSREALATGVDIQIYEPVPPKPVTPDPDPKQKNKKNSKKAKAVEKPKDPLTEQGYVKTSVLLQAQGGYLALQAFLRRMESLQLLVQPSDLALKAMNNSQPRRNRDTGAGLKRPLTQVNLRLSFFDRKAGADRKAGPTKQ